MPDSESYGTKLLRFWAPNGWAAPWLVFGFAALLFFQTVIHEGTHWVTGGGEGTLIPFVHLNTDFDRTLVGATTDSIGFIAMPQIVGLVLLVALILVFIFTSPSWHWLRGFLTWWYLGIAVDLLFNTGLGLFGVFRRGTDWARFAAESGEGLAKFLSWVILLCILSQLLWIRISRWHVNRPPRLGFYEFPGFAVFLGVLSLTAAIVSLAVDHPSVGRNGWFYLVWIGQAVSVLWFLRYLERVMARRK
jgi:hypothetical protein